MEKFGFFSEQLAHNMALQRMTAKALATRLGCSYEHVRKMAIGESLPSPPMLQRLCNVFGWSERKFRKLVKIDRMRREFGDNFWIMQGKHPRCDAYYILSQFMSREQQEYFAACCRLFVARKQAAQAQKEAAAQEKNEAMESVENTPSAT